MRRIVFTLLVLLALATPAAAAARGGSYAVTGGTAVERARVRAALEASSFDWGLIPATIQVRVVRGIDSYATRGEVFLDADLLDSERFAWGTVQHEFAHQVDFFLLDDAKRAAITASLGGSDWCYGVAGLPHAAYGCERFASTLAWAYWPSHENSMKPDTAHDESGAMAPAAFRALLAGLIGAPATVSSPFTAKAFAPKTRPRR